MTIKGTCQVGDMVDGQTCDETDVIEIKVNQNGRGDEVLGTLCLTHAAQWRRHAFPASSAAANITPKE